VRAITGTGESNSPEIIKNLASTPIFTGSSLITNKDMNVSKLDPVRK